jgi:hypothetical protein
MKMIDNIMQDVWKAKDGIAMECGYSPVKLAQLLKEQQASSVAMVVDYHNRTTIKPVCSQHKNSPLTEFLSSVFSIFK